MVPNLSKGAGIKGTALYVLHDKRTEEDRAIGAALTPEHQTTHRVGFTTTRNLSTDDPELAWRLMCATAANREALKEAAGVHKGGRQSKNQCGHIALSWELQTQPDRAEMERAAEGALKSLGWDKLQALIVEHRDEEHAHCHIVVNLIDPETGRTAPNAKNDYEKLQRWAHEYDRERGIEACPNRAARMDRSPDDPTPPKPAQRWLSRKEYEAVTKAERAEHRAQALDRYREAAAHVREQFRPEWAQHYKDARAELRAFDREAKHQLADLANAKRPEQLIAFYNEHRELIWRGIDDDKRPGNSHTLLTKGFLQAALDRAQAGDKAILVDQHAQAKAELQARHTDARQEAYRQAWVRPPEPAEVVPFPTTPAAGNGRKVTAAAALAVSAAGLAAYALNRQKGQERNADRDLAAAADRIARQPSRAANANVEPAKRTETVKPAPDRDDLAAKRAQLEREAAELRTRHKAAHSRDRDWNRERKRD